MKKHIARFNDFISVGTGGFLSGCSLSGSGFVLTFSIHLPKNGTQDVDAIVLSSLNVRLYFLAALLNFITL